MDDGRFSLKKKLVQASRSSHLKMRLSVPVISVAAFAHIRYTAVGNTKYQNCHPFIHNARSGRQWIQNHNGTIFDFTPLNTLLGYCERKLAFGGTNHGNPFADNAEAMQLLYLAFEKL